MRQFTPRCRFVMRPSSFLSNAIGRLRLGLRFLLVGAGLFGLAAPAWAQTPSYTLVNPTVPAGTQSFSSGSDGYSASGVVPSPAVNLLAAPTTTLFISGGAPLIPANGTASSPTTGSGTSATTWSQLVDGSYGVVAIAGGGGFGTIGVNAGFALTYTFASATSLSTIDVFSGWGDAGRSAQSYTISYALAASPNTRSLNSAPRSAPAPVSALTDNGRNWRSRT